MKRSTRSGKTFAQWDGPLIVANNTEFDFPQLVRDATAREAAFYEAMEEPEDYPTLPSDSEDIDFPSENAVVSPCSTLPASSHSTRGRDDAETTDIKQMADRLRKKKCGDTETADNNAETIDIEETAHQRRKRLKRTREHAARSKKRNQKNQTVPYHIARPSVQAKYMQNAVPLVTVHNLSEASNVASTGWVGLDDRTRDQHEYLLEELVGPLSTFKFDYVPWTAEKPIPIISQDGILTAILAGKPETSDWPRLAQEATDLLKDANNRCRVPQKAHLHRRGAFVALQTGVSHGGGQKCPSNLRCGCRTNVKILQELNKAEPFRRVAGFANSVMAHWAPDLYSYYSTHLDALYTKYPSLQRIFPSSVFAASTYNLGPRTVCYKHLDFANLPFGWCAVTAFGDYDHTKGGHLILWDCHLVIEFPPGATILLPSATITHSNVPISEHETRFSFAQYTAGGLFQWVHNGFQKGTDFEASLSPEGLAEKRIRDQNRWQFGLSLLPRFKISSPSPQHL